MIKRKIKESILVFVLTTMFLNAQAQTLFLSAAAGYKKPIMEITGNFEKSTGIDVQIAFGNINTAMAQAYRSGDICCVIGDERFMKSSPHEVSFSAYHAMGNGTLCLAWRKRIQLDSVESLFSSDEVQTIVMPDSKKAIYGIAASEYLDNTNYRALLIDKLLEASSVPQTLMYLLTGEADAGFINLTESLANAHKLGGYIELPLNLYGGLIMSAGVVEEYAEKKELKQFLEHLETPGSKAILLKYGIK